MTGSAPGTCRRWGAIVLLRLAGAVLRGATALYLRRAIPTASLRAALSAASWLGRAGAVVVLGTRSRPKSGPAMKEDQDDRIE
ncbi:hypothetical protein ACFFWD_08660 [Bradyrhizobium erythrophlei]|uniref:hypothetical protein n=1 Tax=Bradyrhizobium erythrophlei TaxID=1437360 RepID=UPI0035E8781A